MTIAIGLLYGFDRMGWITVHSGVQEYWLTLGLIALASVFLEWLLFRIWVTVTLLTHDLGMLLAPIIAIIGGWICLWGVSSLTLFMTINVRFWWMGFFMSIAYGLLRIPTPKATVAKDPTSS